MPSILQVGVLGEVQLDLVVTEIIPTTNGLLFYDPPMPGCIAPTPADTYNQDDSLIQLMNPIHVVLRENPGRKAKKRTLPGTVR